MLRDAIAHHSAAEELSDLLERRGPGAATAGRWLWALEGPHRLHAGGGSSEEVRRRTKTRDHEVLGAPEVFPEKTAGG